MQAQLPTRWCRIVAITLAAAFTIVAAPAVATHDARADGTISARTTDPLSVRWVAPTDGSTVSSGLIRSRCEVATRDSSAITMVEFFLDGSLVSTDTAPPYPCQFETTTLAGGTHILKARAFDAMGNVLSSYAFVSTPTTGPQPTTVTVQGDSLTVGSWWRMPAELGPSFKLVSVSARIGRPSVKGLALLHRQQLGRTVVFALGTNDWWSTPQAYLKHLTEALQLIGPHRCMAGRADNLARRTSQRCAQ